MPTKVKSITFDNGFKNSRLNLLNIQWYATSAYSWGQKGIIEQKHKQLRKFIPKSKSLNKLNQEMCDLISLLINDETYLQNPSKYKLGYIINKQELEKLGAATLADIICSEITVLNSKIKELQEKIKEYDGLEDKDSSHMQMA